MSKITAIAVVCSFLLSMPSFRACAQPLGEKKHFTRQDTLRGTITPERAWWDVQQYRIFVAPDYKAKTIQGTITIVYKTVSKTNGRMQIDLQQPMKIDRAYGYDGQEVRLMKTPTGGGTVSHRLSRPLKFTRDGNVYYFENAPHTALDSITIEFSGAPVIAVNPPWTGGWIFTKDARGRPWMTVACQGLGASVWYPCKDHQSDEPDRGATISIKVPTGLTAVANGKLADTLHEKNTTTWTWIVRNPINNYNIVPYIGYYTHWDDSFASENGHSFPLQYWVLDYNLDKAKAQFGRDVKPMLKCFEYWFGPYPFQEDSYKLVEAPHLGMEHQSAVAYGNQYMDGYLGMDLSGTGWGKKWDYIIVHESGHEWFANSITTNDIADMWVHEGFTDYSEVLFVECQYGRKAADEYCQGLRRNIENDIPIIGPYGVNQEGSGDMYAKGANMLHTIRTVINNDDQFRAILRGLNATFYHKTVDTHQIEDYMSQKAGIDLSKIFDQYLRTTQIPQLEYRYEGDEVNYRWTNCVPGFAMPVYLGAGNAVLLKPVTNWQKTKLPEGVSVEDINPNYYVTLKKD